MKVKNAINVAAVCALGVLSVAVPVVQAEVSASVAAANMYYFRGVDMGGGAAISADVNYSASGFTVGVWTTSGDEALGTEYDIYAGYAGEAGDFTYGGGFISYNYPEVSQEPGEYTEAYLSAGYAGLELTYYKAITGGEYTYTTLAYSYDKFTVLYGLHEDDSSHLDLTYTYNDNLSFTIGQVVEENDNSYFPNADTKFVVTLTLPL